MATTRYVKISLNAPALGIVAALQTLVDVLNKQSPGLGWEFAAPAAGSLTYVVYRDVESDAEFDDAVRALSERVGGDQYVKEADSPFV